MRHTTSGLGQIRLVRTSLSFINEIENTKHFGNKHVFSQHLRSYSEHKHASASQNILRNLVIDRKLVNNMLFEGSCSSCLALAKMMSANDSISR